MSRREKIESLLNFDDPITMDHYRVWDKGDCSEIGLCEILLAQMIREHKNENDENYDTDYDQIQLRYE
jgi:hypothetical protein